VFSEITPKVIGATRPEVIAFPAGYILAPLLKLAYPVTWFVNLFVQGLLWLLRLQPKGNQPHTLSMEELRTLVLEGGNFLPQKHQNILLNLFDLESITVEDAMTPRIQIEAIDIESSPDEIRRQIATSNHTRLPVYAGAWTTSSHRACAQVLNLSEGERSPPTFSRDHAPTVFHSFGYAAAHPVAEFPGASSGQDGAGGGRIRGTEGSAHA